MLAGSEADSSSRCSKRTATPPVFRPVSNLIRLPLFVVPLSLLRYELILFGCFCLRPQCTKNMAMFHYMILFCVDDICERVSRRASRETSHDLTPSCAREPMQRNEASIDA